MVSNKIVSLEEIAERFISSISSDLQAFVFDSNVIDPSMVSRLVSVAGVEQYFRRFVHRHIIVYALDIYKIERQCRADQCRSIPPERQRICVAQCIHSRTREIVDMVAHSIRDAVDMIRG